MQLSADHKHEFYSPDYMFYKCIAENGSEITKVITADDEAGWLIRACTDEEGMVVAEGNEIKTERLELKFKLVAIEL